MSRFSIFRSSIAIIAVLICIFAYSDKAHATSEPAHKVSVSFSSANSASTGGLDDSNYETNCSFKEGDVITVTSGEPVFGLYIRWRLVPGSWTLTHDGTELACGENGFLHEYVAIEGGTTSAQISLPSGGQICDILAYSDGELPGDVQVWKPMADKADFLVFSTHADDEILFLGGVLATYAGERELAVQVAYMTNYWNALRVREHEKLDGIWEVGVRNYPLIGPFDDNYAADLAAAESVYDYDKVAAWTTETIRRFKPLVVVTQDFNGEYGHGGHRLLAKAVAESVDNSASEDYRPESVQTYGAYDVPKTYFHLYDQNRIVLELHHPIENLGGRDAVKAASDAYLKHESQQWCWFYVSDDPNDSRSSQINCSYFGLYRSTVGSDVNNDMMDNLVSYEEQARIEEEKAAEEARLAEEEAARKAAEEEAARLAAEEAAKEAETDKPKEKTDSESDPLVTVLIVVIVVFVAVMATMVVMYMLKSKRRRR